MFFIVQIYYLITNTTAQIRDSGTALLENTGYVEARSAASRFLASLRLKAFNTGIAILMMSIMLNHKITQKFSVTIINQTVIKNIQYLLLVIPVFIGMALVGSMVLGPYDKNFAEFSRSMIAVMLFTIGRIGRPLSI